MPAGPPPHHRTSTPAGGASRRAGRCRAANGRPRPTARRSTDDGPPPQQVWPQEGYGPAGPMASPRLVRRSHPGQRPRPAAPHSAGPGMAPAGLQGQLRSDQSRAIPDELRQIELENQIRGVLRGHYKVGVMGKGGVGKTTVSASVGSVFAELRQDDRVVAIDADTAFGKLGSRVDPNAQGSYWELASDQHLESFADVRSRVGNNAAGCSCSPGGDSGPAAGARSGDLPRSDRPPGPVLLHLDRRLQFHDGLPVTQEVLRDLDALIVVSSPWVDGAAAAGQTLDWLAARG